MKALDRVQRAAEKGNLLAVRVTADKRECGMDRITYVSMVTLGRNKKVRIAFKHEGERWRTYYVTNKSANRLIMYLLHRQILVTPERLVTSHLSWHTFIKRRLTMTKQATIIMNDNPKSKVIIVNKGRRRERHPPRRPAARDCPD